MTKVKHDKAPIAIGREILHGGKVGMTVEGKVITEFGDTFIVTDDGGWSVYHKVDPDTLKYKNK